MSHWQVVAQFEDLPADWRTELAQMLGEKPRRIGLWAELGLYGALRCLTNAGEAALPAGALLLVASRSGTRVATGAALDQMADDLPMPLTFLQTQPSQLLALLAARLKWRGNASFLAGGDLDEAMQLAQTMAGPAGALIGWVDETGDGVSRWRRTRRSD